MLFQRSANIRDDARLDVKARGFWRESQIAFFDVRVTNPDSNSQKETPLNKILKRHEGEKKRHYNRRIMEVEHGTFTPLVFTTKGVMGPECSVFHRSLAQKLSEKNGERYEDITRYIRIKISFLALKSSLTWIKNNVQR